MNNKYNLPFNLELARESNTLITGANMSGKTNLACNIASVLKSFGQVITIDVSGVWKTKSDLTHYFPVKYRNQSYPMPFSSSMIYDLSLLRVTEQKEFADDICLWVWNRQVEKSSFPVWIILEEAQLYLKSIRGQISEDIYRLVTAGRNHKIRVLAITPDLSMIDTNIIRLSGQRYHGMIEAEENTKRKFRNTYSSDWCRIACEGLELGDFIYKRRRNLKVVSTREFSPRSKPKQYIPYSRSKPKPVQPQFKKRKSGLARKIDNFIINVWNSDPISESLFG